MEYSNNSSSVLPQYEWRVVEYTELSLVDGSTRTISYSIHRDKSPITNEDLIESDIIVPEDDKYAHQEMTIGDVRVTIRLASTKYVGKY